MGERTQAAFDEGTLHVSQNYFLHLHTCKYGEHANNSFFFKDKFKKKPQTL